MSLCPARPSFKAEGRGRSRDVRTVQWRPALGRASILPAGRAAWAPRGLPGFNLNFPHGSIVFMSIFLCKDGPEPGCTFNKCSWLKEWPSPPLPTSQGHFRPRRNQGRRRTLSGPLCAPKGLASRELKLLKLASIKQHLEMFFSLREEIVTGVYFLDWPSKAFTGPKY